MKVGGGICRYSLNAGASSQAVVPQVVPPQIQPYPDYNVGNQHDGVVDIGHQEDVDRTEGARHAQQADHGSARRQPDGKELMMDVVLVRFEGAFPLAETDQDHTDDVEGRDNQRTEGDDKSAFGIRGHVRIDLAVFDGKETNRISQREAAGISHKNLPRTLGAAEDIVIEERDEHAKGGDGQHGIAPQPLVDEEECEDEQGNAAQSRSQPVDAVYQVDGVGDEDDGEHGEGHTDIGRQRMDAEQAVQVVNPQPGKREEGGADELDDEFLVIAHSHQVIGNAGEVEQRHPAGEKQQFGQQVTGIDGGDPIPSQQPYRIDEAEGEQYRGEERDAAQAGDGFLVHLARIRNIEQLLAHRDEQDAGDKHTGDKDGYDEGKYKIKDEQRYLDLEV